MGWSFFGSGKRKVDKTIVSERPTTRFTTEGVVFPGALAGSLTEFAALVAQLEDEGFAERDGDSAWIEWANLYRLMSSPVYAECLPILGLPPVQRWRLALSSRGSLTDREFSVAIAGWIDPDDRPLRSDPVIEGAVLRTGSSEALLPLETWETLRAIAQFHVRPRETRNADSNRRAWAAIRTRAIAAGSELSDFLKKTIVLTPEKIRIRMRKGAGGAIEIIPGFDGEPLRWLEIFDRLGSVGEHYEIPDGEGLAHVIISPEARTVLREIKRMPGRRVAGERAEAFVRNPFATLGPDADRVIDPQQFEQARDEAGISFAHFTAIVRRDDMGRPFETGILVEDTCAGCVSAEERIFEGAAGLKAFLAKLDARIAMGAQCCHWEGVDLEILGDTLDQATLLRAALDELRGSASLKASELFDITRYSERVEGFGVEKTYYAPFIAKKSQHSGWFPENVEFGLYYTPEGGGETVAVSLSDKTLGAFRKEVARARAENRESFPFPGCPKPIKVAWAQAALEALGSANATVSSGTFDPHESGVGGRAPIERKGLVVKPNIDTLDYEERRGRLAMPEGLAPTLPSSLKRGIQLKDHQKTGVAWLQHLWSKSPGDCRGALLADDMGLGKTIQLLAFMAAAIEGNPHIDPFLVVAPVSLLENWKEEIGKFLEPCAVPVLTLYGSELAQQRLPRSALDEGLAGAGITGLLRRDWLGNAKLVLTTYETLRDLEFSLALQRWSMMVCDEAQKIKNPNALITRAAKKQNARFRIACTGTPVENTLTDLWCLFDFVQPGLLGTLKNFGARYRRPIEAQTEEEKARVLELRELIEPQKLRRVKAEVAGDLPRKIEVPECRSLPLSDRQRAYYADAVGLFRKGSGYGVPSGLQSHLELLQYLRRLCSDPRPPGSVPGSPEPVSEIVRHSPKMAWLLDKLQSIRTSGEKAIVFCEFRDLQRTLQRAIHERLGFLPEVINGDTAAAADNSNNRQKRIRTFQEAQGFGVIILSPLAVGFGVNIQAANHVIHFTRTWNPAREDQATDRAYRIGQTRDVFVYYPVVVAGDFITFDQKLDALLEWKRSLSADMLNGAENLRPSDFGDLEAPGGGHAVGSNLIRADE
ncbi:MAG: DEAD/DEAH box helicase [Candidatus Competibacteraceae bacterium]|nr:MAG: DEAD/DEAH box helicase [Candidatus Competibacteraceae bacterium]